jgi:hypothetical protein
VKGLKEMGGKFEKEELEVLYGSMEQPVSRKAFLKWFGEVGGRGEQNGLGKEIVENG